MAKGFLLIFMSFFFLVPNVFMILAMATEKATTSLPAHNQNEEDHVTITGASAPVPLPSSSKSAAASKPIATRTNNENQKDLKSSSAASIFPEHGKTDSAIAPSTEDHGVVTDAHQTTPDENYGSEAAAAPAHGNNEHDKEEHHEVADSAEASHAESPLGSRKIGHHRYHPSEKSVAGGGVILGGLATTFLVSIACYIRATRRNKKNNKINNISDREKDPQETTSP